MELRLPNIVQLTVCLTLIKLAHCQQQEKLTSQNPCVNKASCHECIQTPTCAWCSQPEYGEKNRCFQPNLEDPLKQCDEAYIYNPDNVFSVVDNRNLSKASKYHSSQSGAAASSSSSSSSSGSSYGGHSEAVQISPQRVSLKLRINEAYRMMFEYAQAEDYPVDLYYLMDLSKSMEDDKEKLSSLGDILSESMQKITSNFRLGFGSFVDKVVMPFVSTVPKNLKEPCPSCEAPYGFHNVMSLSQDTSRFSGQVRSAAVSGNIDAPEGGFDAIMQAIVCREQIGWREKARRLLVFSTDAGFHYAGDGKLGGIVKPNDGLCHLDRSGLYTHSTTQDYPSISQINSKVKENHINLIFAVTSEQIGVYERLRAHIEGASSGMLSNDSANVVDLVKEQYNKISSNVEMKDSASNAIKVTYYSRCLQPNGPLKQTNKCDGLKVGTVVQFQAEIEVTACPPDRSQWKQSFRIYPVGINESLTIDLEMQCDCPCETPGNAGYKENSPLCSGFGTLKCGICDCDGRHFGRKCECDAENTLGHDIKGCKPSDNSTVECSGRGTCFCNQCVCDPRPNQDEKITGQYCECDNFSCDRHNGVLCSGPDQGTCDCGKCVCKTGWTGPACDCRSSNDTCIPPGGGPVCSDKGVCECGVCKCIETEEGRYSGKYCEKCPTCPGRCLEFKDCIQCQVYKTGPLSAEECAKNCTITPTLVKKVEANEDKDENLCAYFDEEGCKFEYVYAFDNQGKIILRAQENRECPPHVYILGLVLGVIGAIVLIGLAFLCLWKVLTSIHDRREFAKFEKERMLAKWDTGENPIYKQATSTFQNPTYKGK